jgi:hypothetical protein
MGNAHMKYNQDRTTPLKAIRGNVLVGTSYDPGTSENIPICFDPSSIFEEEARANAVNYQLLEVPLYLIQR